MKVGETLAAAPVMAVLRGITPQEAEPIGDALVAAGLCALEVTLDSPDPFESLKRLSDRHGARVVIAAGTVLTPAAASAAAEAGASLIVSPGFSPAVVAETKRLGLPACPGVMTPSEAFAALEAGADFLKLFPGDVLGAKGVKALRAVIPSAAPLMVTGGVDETTIPQFLKAGAMSVGVGSALFAPGKPPQACAEAATRFLKAARA